MTRLMNSAVATASPAPSVAVTKPPKMPPRMITGSRKAQAASLKVAQTRLTWNRSSTGKFLRTRDDIGRERQPDGAERCPE